jgi:hypothetical protein
MSDDRGSNDADASATTPADADWSANGKHVDEVVAPATEAADAATSEVEATPDDAGPAQADDGSTFLSALVEAMQTTASAERARVAEETDQRREAHLTRVKARRETEATAMRELAGTDLKAIDAWAEDERRRIQEERQRRATARQALLETTLAEHGATIDREIQAVEAAIGTYRADTDAFFATLGHETDPVEIARNASKRPAFPALETIGKPVATDAPVATEAAAEAETTGEGVPLTGVMARPAPADLGTSWARWNSSIAATETVPADDAELAAPEATAPAPEATAPAPVAPPTEESSSAPTPLTASAVVSGQGRVLQTTPVSRPMSWLRRDRDSSEPPTTDR